MANNVMGGHPKGLYLLFSVEMWERFSYYGMRALLVLYLIQYLFQGMDESKATMYAGSIYGWYTGLIYLTPLIGGYIADKFLGQRRCISIGAIVMAIGLFTLAASGFACVKQYSVLIFTIGLTLMIIANGFFKSNISTIVGMLYGDDKQKRDAGFTIFYMGINLGAFFSPLICGTLAQIYGFKYGFMAAGIGIIFGYITYKAGEKKLLGEHGLKPFVNKCTNNETDKIQKKLTLHERRRIWSLFILMIFSIFFWICFEQAGCSFTLFAENSTNRMVLGHEIPTGWFQSLNPLFIISIAPLMSMLWGWLASKGKEPNSVTKFCIALTLISTSAIVMAIAAHFTHGGTYLVSSWWLVLTYLCATLAELCLSPIGLSLVTKLAPVQFASILMGTWFLSSFFGNLAAGVFAGYYNNINHTLFFLILAAAALSIAIVLFFLRPLLKFWMGKN
jgi:POT family proton-dependent oligopeptide transporter